MSASVGSGDPNGQDVELNLAPIIDAFVVLISFLLISASMMAIGILDAGISAPGKAAKNATPPPVNISIALQKNQRIKINVTGQASQSFTLNANSDGKWNLDKMTEHLKTIKGRWPKVNAVTLQAENNIEYRDIVQAMHEARQTLPAVLLGGF